MRQLNRLSLFNREMEIVMSNKSNQRIRLYEDRKYRDCGACGCGQN